MPFNRQALIALLLFAACCFAHAQSSADAPAIRRQVLQVGCAQLDIDAQASKQTRNGESLSIPQGVMHRELQYEVQSAMVLGGYVIEKGMPQAVPVAAPAASKA